MSLSLSYHSWWRMLHGKRQSFFFLRYFSLVTTKKKVEKGWKKIKNYTKSWMEKNSQYKHNKQLKLNVICKIKIDENEKCENWLRCVVGNNSSPSQILQNLQKKTMKRVLEKLSSHLLISIQNVSQSFCHLSY